MKTIAIEVSKAEEKISNTFSLPENWEEVPDSAFQHLVTLYLKTPEQMDEYDKTVRVFVLLAGAKAWSVVKELEAEELYPLLEHINWVFDQLDMVRNRFPSIQLKKNALQSLALFGPSNGLENIRFGEWLVADGYFVDYSHTGNAAALNGMLATIYRPAGKGSAYTPGAPDFRGDKRQKFNDQNLDERITMFEKYSSDMVKKAIFVWYASCRQQIISQYPEFFPQDTKPTDQGEGWFGLYDDLMGDPKFGGAEKLEDTFVHTVFASVNRSQIKMRELQDKYDL